MVNLVEDWEGLHEYGGDKQGYQVFRTNRAVEVHSAVWKLGFKKQFDKNVDPLLARVLAFCIAHKHVRISETVRDELFFN